MKSYKERQFRNALSSPKQGFWPHCKNDDYNLLDDRQVCWVVQVRTGAELPGKQEAVIWGRQADNCAHLWVAGMEKGSFVSSLIAGSGMWPEEQVVVSGGLEETTLQTQQSWGWWAGVQRETLGCLLSAIGLTLAVVTVLQPGLQDGYWTVHSECAVGAEWHWICTNTHIHTHHEGLYSMSKRQHSKIKEERPLPINKGVLSINKA